jgi:hypothetical protein
MRSLVVLPLLAAFTLAACQQEEAVVAENESVESVSKKVAAANIKPQPGRWESTMKFGKMDIPNLPAEAKAAMQKQLGAGQTFTSCLTPEEAERPDTDFFQKGAEGCKYDHFAMAGGRIDAAMVCKEQGTEMKMTMAGTYSQTSYDIRVQSQGEMQPGMPMSMDMSISSRRVGDCTGKENQ